MTHIWQPWFVQAAVEMMSDELDETLFIVTSDHSHTMSFAGYPARGTDIREPPRMTCPLCKWHLLLILSEP